MKWVPQKQKLLSTGPTNALTKNVKVLWTLEINQCFGTILRMFIQEKWLNLLKISKLCGVFTCPSLSSLFFGSLENQQPCNYSSCENQQTRNHRRGTIGLELCKCHVLKSLFDQTAPWKAPFSGLVFIWPDVDFTLVEYPYP